MKFKYTGIPLLSLLILILQCGKVKIDTKLAYSGAESSAYSGESSEVVYGSSTESRSQVSQAASSASSFGYSHHSASASSHGHSLNTYASVGEDNVAKRGFAYALPCASDSLEVKLDKVWILYKKIFRKCYSSEKETIRRKKFNKNLHDVFLHNVLADIGEYSYTLGVNEYSDLPPEEFRAKRLGYIDYDRQNGGVKGSRRHSNQWVKLSNFRAPESLDWRDQGLVTPIKDQGQCGSCWAFSALVSLEGQQLKNSGEMVQLSEQNLVDCSKNDGNSGCNGGWMTAAFEYIQDNEGIDSQDSYPYEARDSKCRFDPNSVAATITGYVELPEGDEQELLNAVATIGPISVAINAGQTNFQNYKSGIYDEPRCTADELNHAVALVGYGTEDGKDYWLIKNSWGESWGINGYAKMARNKNNQCGIASKASYPTVNTAVAQCR